MTSTPTANENFVKLKKVIYQYAKFYTSPGQRMIVIKEPEWGVEQ